METIFGSEMLKAQYGNDMLPMSIQEHLLVVTPKENLLKCVVIFNMQLTPDGLFKNVWA